MTAAKAVLHRGGGRGPDLLFLHGFGADRLSWTANAPMLADAATVWSIDLPGHGTAPNDFEAADPATLASAVAAELSALTGPAVVVGHSLGGTVALHLAQIAPEAVAGLVLIAPAGFAGSRPDRDFLSAFPEVETQEQGLDLLGRLVERKRLISPAMADHVLSALSQPGRREALRRIGAALADAEPAPMPGSIPICVIWGQADAVMPEPENMPDGITRLSLPNIGHMPQVEAAMKVNAAIRDALATR